MTTPKGLHQADLQIGVEYDVRFDDCCVEGTFRAVFLGWQHGTELSPEYREDEYDSQHWSNGVIFQNSQAVSCTPAESALPSAPEAALDKI